MIKRVAVLRMLKFRLGMFTHDGSAQFPPARSHVPSEQVSCSTSPVPCGRTGASEGLLLQSTSTW